MAFPILALLAAAASDMGSRKDEADALASQARHNRQAIMQRRAAELGGSPYGMMAAEGKSGLDEISRHAEAGRNNNIGNMLQAYLKTADFGGGGEKYGDDYAKQLAHDPGEGGFGMGNVMGKAQLDSWDDDPWGDAGF